MTSARNKTELVSSTTEHLEKDPLESGQIESAADDLENKKAVKDNEDGNEHWVQLALLTALLVLLALQFSMLLSEYLVDNDNGTTSSICLVASMIFGIIALVTLFEQTWAGKFHVRDNTGQNVQVNALLRNNLALVGLVFFCPFACLLDIFQLYTEVSCGESWKMINAYQFYPSDVAFYVLHVAFMSMELLFCVQFRRLVLNANVSKLRKFCVKLSLTLIIAVNLGEWLNIILHETIGTKVLNEGAGNDSFHSRGTCLLSTFGDVEEHVRGILYPFTVEFSLLVLEFVVSHFIFSNEHNEHEIKPSLPITHKKHEHHVVFQRQMCSRYSSCDQQSSLFAVTSPLVIIFGALPNLVCFTLAFFSREEIFGNVFAHKSTINNQRFMVFYWILMILLVLVGYVSAANFKAAKDKLKGIDFLVMASAFGPLLSRMLRVIIIAENLELVAETFEPTFILLPEVLQLLQLFLQLPFLFYADSVETASAEDKRKPRRRIFKAAVLSLALWNITLWLIESVLLKVNAVYTIFKDSRWQVVDGIFRPFAVFFRFNSFLILLRAFLR